jgi:two-component system LytT family response regulator
MSETRLSLQPRLQASKIRTILADGDPIGRSGLKRLLEKESDIEILAECVDGISATEAVRARAPDALFLEINLPKMDGLAVLDALGVEYQPAVVVFVTASDGYAVRAFDACALDYILKPVSPERLMRALGRIRERLLSIGNTGPISPPFSAASPESTRFLVRSRRGVAFVAPAEIDWVEAAGNYVILHAGSNNHMMRETMAGVEARLPAEIFLRVSRSAILNLHEVKELQSSVSGEIAVLARGQRIRVTRHLNEMANRLSRL